MKILIFCEGFPPRVGGIETHSYCLAQELFKQGVELVVVTSSQPDSDLVDQLLPFRVVRLPMHKKGIWPRFFYYMRVLQLAFRYQADLAICTHAFRYCGIMGWLRRLFKLKFLLFAHGNEVCHRKAGKRKRAVQLLCRQAETILAVSEYTKNLLVKIAVDVPKIIVLPNGFIPLTVEEETVVAVKQQYQLDQKTVLLTVGRLVKRKGHLFVIQALPEVLKTYPQLVYLIVGSGDELPVLQQEVQILGLTEHVLFAGKVSDQELPAFYAACDLFTMMSYERKEQNDVEGFGIVYLEAGGFKKPVLAHRSGGVADAVIHGETGWLLDDMTPKSITKALLLLLGDDALRLQLGEGGYQRATNAFPWPTIAGRIKHICENLVTP